MLNINIKNWKTILKKRCQNIQPNEIQFIEMYIKKIIKEDVDIINKLFLMSEPDGDIDFLNLCKKENKNLYESQQKRLMKLIYENIDQSMVLPGLYLSLNFERILVDMINIKLNQDKKNNTSPFIYAMQ